MSRLVEQPGHKPLRAGAALVIVMVSFAALALAPAPVHATWELSKSTNGIIITRDLNSTDTTLNANVQVFYDYKWGDVEWDATSGRSPFLAASYSRSKTYPQMYGTSGTAYEIDLPTSHRLQLVLVSWTGASRGFAVVNDPMKVTVENTPTVGVAGTVAVSGSVEATVSNPTTATGSVEITGTPSVVVRQSRYDNAYLLAAGMVAFASAFVVGHKATGAV